MEANVFTAREVVPKMKDYILVELFTDAGTPEEDANRRFRTQEFKVVTNPLYAIIEPVDPGGAVKGG